MPRRDRKGVGEGADNGPDRRSAGPPLVNRKLELDLLREHVKQVARGGPGHAVVLVGESGVGKSRLAAEAQAEADRLEMRVVAAQCLGRGAEPLLPMKEALARHLGRSPDRIQRVLLGAAPHLLDAVPFVGAFLARLGEKVMEGLQMGGSGLKGVYESLARVLLGIADKHGLCLVVEDLHAADQDTLYFLHYLVRKIRDHRVLVLLTAQEEQLREAPQLADLVGQWTAEGYAVLTVLPLERAHVGEYVRTVAAEEVPRDQRLVDRLFRLTGGNPFFLKETLQMLAEENNGPPAALGAEPSGVPPKVEAVLARRLARADVPTRRFLEASAVVLDTTAELEPITYALDVQPASAVQALGEACRLRLMREGPQGEVGFVHALMQRAVYAEMGENYRRHLHGRVGEWLERDGRLASASFHYERARRQDDLIRAALGAASQAEHAGMYHSALMLYQQVRPFVDITELGPRLGRALIVLGDWQQADEVIERLPAGDGRVRLLRSELKFVRGDFHGAAAEARAALGGDTVDEIDVLIRLADIDLYLGDLAEADQRGRAALRQAEARGSANQRARCLGILGATAFFSGRITDGKERFDRALDLLTSRPQEEQDRTIHTTLLGNLGCVAEARSDWPAAQRCHSEALRLRRGVADARGALHSLHALGRVRAALGDPAGARELLDEAERLATDLDEPLEHAKVIHTRAEWALRAGNADTARRLAGQALAVFERCATAYDVAHAQLTLAAACAASGLERQAVAFGAAGRAAVHRHGYGLLGHLNPQTAFPVAERIAAALTGYACGDALGLPWESQPPSASEEQIQALPAPRGADRGATSDDTALTLLVCQHLADQPPEGPIALLRTLAERASTIHGLGPSTLAAIQAFRTTGQPPASGGDTNGAAMRALPVGWATPPEADGDRRRLTIELSHLTHPSAEATCAACVMAACASWAVEGASPRLILDVAVTEATEATRVLDADPRLADMLAAVARGAWTPPARGVSLDPYETVSAALACFASATSVREALLSAVRLGGDTDTVAALVGGLAGARRTAGQIRPELPWADAVHAPGQDAVAGLAASLASMRSAATRPRR